MFEAGAEPIVFNTSHLDEFFTNSDEVKLEIRSLEKRFRDSVCRYPEHFVGPLRTQAVTIFLRAIEKLDSKHPHLSLDENGLIEKICGC